MSDTIFLSYAHEDRHQIEKVLKELSRRGVMSRQNDVTLDAVTNIKTASDVKSLIRERIESTSKVVLLWTEAGSKSQWVNYEAGMAEALGKRIIVVVPKKSAPQLPENLKDVQIIKF